MGKLNIVPMQVYASLKDMDKLIRGVKYKVFMHPYSGIAVNTTN